MLVTIFLLLDLHFEGYNIIIVFDEEFKMILLEF